MNIKGTFNLKQIRGVIWSYYHQNTPWIAISIFLGLKDISMELYSLGDIYVCTFLV